MTTPIPEVSVKPKPLYRRLGVFLCGAVATAVITFYVNAYLSRPAHEKTDEAALELKTGLGFVSAGDFTRAHAAFDRATALDPMNSAAWANLGAAAAKLGRPTEAIRAYEHSLTLDPDNWLAHYNLACLLTRQGERTEAIEHIARAVAQLKRTTHSRDELDSYIANIRADAALKPLHKDSRFTALLAD
jgi:Flp pilus assembly protein TadD